MDLLPSLPAFAPLAEDQVRDLLIQRERLLPLLSEGRPRRGTPDKLAREEQRQRQALEELLTETGAARKLVFELLDPLVRSGQLTRRALLDILYPAPLTPYPERLNEWVRERLLWFDEQGNPDPQPTAAILLQRALDPRKRKLPPPRSEPRSFYCWRLEGRDKPPLPYELPLVGTSEKRRHPEYKMRPEPGRSLSLLQTAWKGVAWGDKHWVVNDQGAICWLGEPTEQGMADWLLPSEMATLADSSHPEERAVRALSILATECVTHLSL
jgi:hypothetical protein